MILLSNIHLINELEYRVPKNKLLITKGDSHNYKRKSALLITTVVQTIEHIVKVWFNV